MATRLSWLLAFCLSLSVGTAAAQEQSGVITGTVRDSTGAVVPGVVVEARSQAVAGVVTGHSDRAGSYVLLGLAPGRYEIGATLTGFGRATAKDIDVSVGQQLRVDINLHPAGIDQQVTVTGRRTLVDAGHVASYSTIDRAAIEVLPLLRDVTDMLKMAPGVGTGVGGQGIDGATSYENRYILDGLDVSDPKWSTVGVTLLARNIQEVQVKTSGHNAEFRAGTSGVVSMVSRSGSNRFAGSAGILLTDNRWMGKKRPMLQTLPTDPTKPYVRYPLNPTRTWEPTFDLGGPILKDHVWFFGSYNPSIRTVRPTVTFKSTGERRTFSATSRTEEPTWTLTTQPTGNLRVRVSGMHQLYGERGTYPWSSYDGTSTSDPTYDYGAYRYGYAEHTVTGTLDYTPHERLQVNVTAGSMTYNSWMPTLPDRPGVWFGESNEGLLDVPVSFQHPVEWYDYPPDLWATRRDVNRRASLNASLATGLTFAGRHAIKGGVQVERVTNDVDDGYLFPYINIYWDSSYWASDGTVSRGKYGYYLVGQYLWQGTVHANNVGLYLQDDWKVHPRLTINAGVRIDREDIPSYRPGNSGIRFGFGDKIAPRVGFAWDVRENGKWRAYGSYGRFQDSTKLSMAVEQLGGWREAESYYTLDTYDFRSISCSPWAGTCPGRLLETYDYNIPLNIATPALQALGFNSQMESNLKPFQSNELVVGLDHALRPSISVGVRYIHKWIDRALDDIGISLPGMGTVKFIANPGFGIARQVMGAGYPSLPKARRDYDALELTVRRRLANRWMLNGSYTWSRAFGNYGGLADGRSSGSNQNLAFNALYGMFDRNGKEVTGRLTTDYPHQLKLQGAYVAPWGTTVGLSGLLRSGRLLQYYLIQKGTQVFYDGFGSAGRTPTYSNVDLRAQQAFKVRGNVRARVEINVTNLFDQDTVTARQMLRWRDSFSIPDAEFFAGFDPYAIADAKKLRTHPTFGMASSFQPARTVRVSAGIEF